MSTFSFQSLLDLAGTLKQWLGPQGTAYRSAVAASFDSALITADLTGEARNPLKCHASVLPYHAADRKIKRYTNESEASHRQCLAKWKQIHRASGKAYGILRRLRIILLQYGRPLLRYVHTTGDGGMTEWFTLVPGDATKDYFVYGANDPEFSRVLVKPGNWLWDPQATAGHWSRYWIVIDWSASPLPNDGSIEWGALGEWGDGVSQWGQGLPSGAISDCIECCADMQAANSACYGILQVHDASVLLPSGTSATIAPWNYTTYPNGSWDQVNKRNPSVTFSYVR